jgi:hypothetical protein
MVETACLYCHRPFKYYLSMHRKFCSMKCYQDWRRQNSDWGSLAKATSARTLRPCLHISPTLMYAVGALKGDGWTRIDRCTNGTAWKVKLCAGLSEAFALEFSNALRSLGLNASTHLQSKRNYSPVWIVTANSKVFVQWYRQMDSEALGHYLETAELAAAFLKGIYEAEGYLWKLRGYARCVITNTNAEIILLCLNALDTLHLNYSLGESGSKSILSINPTIEAIRFLNMVKPCIKNKLPLPRNRNNSAYAYYSFNKEPWGRN